MTSLYESKDEYDEDAFEYYCTSELVVIDVVHRKELYRSPSAIFTGFFFSGSKRGVKMLTQVFFVARSKVFVDFDNGTSIFIHRSLRPFSKTRPSMEKVKTSHLFFPKLQFRDLSFVKEIAYLPLAEDIPTDIGSVRKGPRSIRWRPDKDSTLCWAEAQDEGDPKKEADPRDIVYTLNVASEETPTVITTTQLRFSGISFCDHDLALVYQYWWNTRRSVTTVISPDDPTKPSKVLFERNFEDIYNDPGHPVSQRTSRGTYVLAKIDGQRTLLFNGRSNCAMPFLNGFLGEGASPQGNRPFLDLLDIDSGNTERIWQSSPPFYETFVSLFNDENGQMISRDDIVALMTRETSQDVRQYRLIRLSNKTETELRILSQFPHPYPHVWIPFAF